MTYKVLIEPPAERDLDEALAWVAGQAAARVDEWYARLLQAILSLKRFPERCPIAPESNAFKIPIRQLIFGRRGGTYRILFTIRARRVHVLHVRHAARRPFRTPGPQGN